MHMKKGGIERIQRRLDTALSVLSVLTMISSCWGHTGYFRWIVGKRFAGWFSVGIDEINTWFFFLLFLLFLCVGGEALALDFFSDTIFCDKNIYSETHFFWECFCHNHSDFLWESQAYGLSMTLLAVVGLFGFLLVCMLVVSRQEGV